MSVEAAMSSQKRAIMQASLSEEKAEQEPDASKGRSMMNKVLKLKESITSEVVKRVTRMQDTEERAVLATTLNAVRKGDTERAIKVLSDRLALLQRRSDKRGDDSSDEEEEPEAQEQHTNGSTNGSKTANLQEQPDTIEAQTSPKDDLILSDRREDWVLAVNHALTQGEELNSTNDAGSPNFAINLPPTRLKENLDRWGYFMDEAPLQASDEVCKQILIAFQALRKQNVPAFYIWMYDAPWQIMLSLWSQAESVLGGRCKLEPTFAAYHLSYDIAAKKGNSYSGTNFSLPHRDYTFSDTYDAEGNLKILTVWIPVTDVDTDSGCMFVVPKEFDPNNDRDDVSQHMLVQHTGWLAGKSFLSFPVAAGRSLAPVKAGTIMGWAGNTIHWGGQCHERSAKNPRASIAWVFRRADAVQLADVDEPLGYDEVRALSLQQRRKLIQGSMDYFKHWSTPRMDSSYP